MSVTYKYQSKGEMILENGMVAFQGYILKITNGLAKRVALVDNKGDGGSNTYYWAYQALFMDTAKAVIINPEFLEVADEFVELLYQESVGVYA